MSKTIKLSNGILNAEIATMGAEILSVKKDGFENMWDADPEFWNGHATILFPICGRLKDNKSYIKKQKHQKTNLCLF